MRNLVAILIVLAGCASPQVTESVPDADVMLLHGAIYDHQIRPIEATLTLLELNVSVQSNELGLFEFPPVDPGLYQLRATAPDHAERTWHLLPSDGNRTLYLTLEGLLTTPSHATQHHGGYVQCMAEYGIISGDCDRLPDYINDRSPEGRPVPEPFAGNDTFRVDVPNQWQTLILDLVFDEEDQPGLAGMRMSVYSLLGDAELLDYARITQESGASSFTVRVDAGATYGNVTVSESATSFRIEVFGEGRGYKTVCGAGECFMGIGAASDVTFDAYATIFLVAPAPADWSFIE